MMIKKITTFFSRTPKGRGNFFYEFIMDTSAKEQKKVIRRIALKVNKEQRETIEKAENLSRQHG